MPARAKLRRRRRTKIIATLGPASATAEVVTRLFHAGADVFRLNFSHGTHENHAALIAIIRELEEKAGRPIGILADVQGPKLRVGRFSGGRVHLQTGQTFRLDLNPTPGNALRVNLPHPEIIGAASLGCTLLLDDGKLRLRVERKRDDALETQVVVGGPLSDRKGVNVQTSCCRSRRSRRKIATTSLSRWSRASTSSVSPSCSGPRTWPRRRRSPPAAPGS